MLWDASHAEFGLLGGFALESRSLPCAVLGLGKAKVSDKSGKLLKVIVLETGNKLNLFRVEMKSWLSDQSVEKACKHSKHIKQLQLYEIKR